MAKDWLIEGNYVEYCSCDMGCPCESMAEPTQGHCTGLVGFHIENGHCDGVDLSDLKVVATFFFPRAIHHGDGVPATTSLRAFSESRRKRSSSCLSCVRTTARGTSSSSS